MRVDICILRFQSMHCIKVFNQFNLIKIKQHFFVIPITTITSLVNKIAGPFYLNVKYIKIYINYKYLAD